MSITDDYRRELPKAKVSPAIVVALGLRFPVQVDAIYNNKRLGLQGTISIDMSKTIYPFFWDYACVKLCYIL